MEICAENAHNGSSSHLLRPLWISLGAALSKSRDSLYKSIHKKLYLYLIALKIVNNIKMIYLLLPSLSHIIVVNLVDLFYLNVVFHEEVVENEEGEDDSHGD